jgi:CubicO group peptidase (beta-lactamase class C family)
LKGINNTAVFISLTFQLLFAGLAPGQSKQDSLDACVRSRMKQLAIPGLQIAVIRHQEIVYLRAFGYANIQDSVAVTPKTRFTINSITKAFTGIAMMQLAEAGKLDLSSPVSRYLDSLPARWQAVTIRQLLTHTSGIPNMMDDDAILISKGGEKASWELVRTLPMDFKPGERFSYNQTNYFLLGKLIDKLSGEPFAQFIEDRQLKVSGMALTVYGDAREVIPHSARGYTVYPVRDGYSRGIHNLFEEFPPALLTAAGLNSTAKEMAQWVIALEQGKLFNDKHSLATLWTPGLLNNGKTDGFSDLVNGYALGWPAVLRPKHRAMAPIGGGRSAVFIYPDDDLAVIILTNLQGSNPETFIDEIAAYYFR